MIIIFQINIDYYMIGKMFINLINIILKSNYKVIN